MFPEVKEIRKMRKKYSAKMYKTGIGTFREIGALEANALRDGALPQKVKELIALGISLTQSCYG